MILVTTDIVHWRPGRPDGLGSCSKPLGHFSALGFQSHLDRSAVRLALSCDRSEEACELKPFISAHQVHHCEAGIYIAVAVSAIYCDVSLDVSAVADSSPCALDLDITAVTASGEGLVISLAYLARERVARDLFRMLPVVLVLPCKSLECDSSHLSDRPFLTL